MQRQQKVQQKAWKQTLLVDKRQIDSLSKDIPKLFPFSATTALNDKISKMLQQNEQAQLKINKEQSITFHKLGDIVHDIEALRNVLKFYDESQEYLLKVQNSSQNILGKLEQFRGKMGVAYQNLADQQDQLDEQLQLYAKKIESMGRGEDYPQKQNIKNNNKEVKVWDNNRKEKPTTKNEEKEKDNRLGMIEQRMKEKQRESELIEKGVMSLGKNLGWPEEDHTDFVSIWHRGGVKNYFQIEEELQSYFSLYTHQQIQQHMNKYIKLRKLTDQKKQLIAEYKNLKEEKKMQGLRMMKLQKNEARQQIEKEEMKVKQQQEQAERKAKLSQWKQRKVVQKKEEEERRAKIQWHKRQEQAIKKRQVDQRNKELLEQWKFEETQKKQEQMRRIKSAKKQVQLDPQAQERIRIREQMLVQKKIELVNDKKREEQMLRQKATKIKQDKFVKYSHVSTKVDKKTTAVKQKQRQKFDGKQRKDANTFGGQLLMQGVRATPSWMK